MSFVKQADGDRQMNNKSMECDIIKDKLNNRIENLRLEDSFETAGKNMLTYLIEGFDELEQYQKVTVNPTVETRKKGLFGKIVVFFKRLSRKIVAWYLQPVCDDQTRFNNQAYIVIGALIAQIEEYQKKQKELEDLLGKMNYEIDLLKRFIEKM